MEDSGGLRRAAPASKAETPRFFQQHDELSGFARAVIEALAAPSLDADPKRALRALAAFSGKLRVHAAMERDGLYPRLLSSPDLEVAEKARELLHEMGDLYDAYFEHVSTWGCVARVREAPASFRAETLAMFTRLRRRMERENRELYPLVQRLEERAPDATSGVVSEVLPRVPWG